MNVQSQKKFTGKRSLVALLGACVAGCGALFCQGHALGQNVTLTDGGSSASINLGGGTGLNGMNNWSVNGQNQLNQQWFWYSFGGGVAQQVNSIGTPTVTTYNGSSGINEVTSVYQNATLSISIDYYLQGGGVGTGNANITESIMVVNKSGTAQNLNFFQYSNFNLLGGAGHDTVQIFGGPGAYNSVRQSNGSTAISESVTAPSSLYAEAAPIGQTLNELNNTSDLTLNGTTTAGPGDVTWALQWNQELAANGGEFDLTKGKSLAIGVVPEPSSIALISLGGIAMGWVLRRKQA